MTDNLIPQGSQTVSGTATGAAAAVTVTLGGTSNLGRTVYLTGFCYQALGATAAGNVTITATYTPASGGAITLGSWSYLQGAGVATVGVPLDIQLIPPMPSGQPITGLTNTTPVGSIAVTATAGAGTTNASLSAWGFLQ